MFASAWDLNSLTFLKKYNLKYNKIASAIVDKKFLREVQRKHTFISTGMSNGRYREYVNISRKKMQF